MLIIQQSLNHNNKILVEKIIVIIVVIFINEMTILSSADFLNDFQLCFILFALSEETWTTEIPPNQIP